MSGPCAQADVAFLSLGYTDRCQTGDQAILAYYLAYGMTSRLGKLDKCIHVNTKSSSFTLASHSPCDHLCTMLSPGMRCQVSAIGTQPPQHIRHMARCIQGAGAEVHEVPHHARPHTCMHHNVGAMSNVNDGNINADLLWHCSQPNMACINML